MAERANLVAWKDGPSLFFAKTKDDPKPYCYCLKQQAFLGKRGLPIKTRPNIFQGYDTDAVIDMFDCENTKKLLNHANRYGRVDRFYGTIKLDSWGGGGGKSLITLFKIIPHLGSIEKCINVGVGYASDLTQEVPRSVLKFAKKYELTVTDDLIRNWETKYPWLQSAESVEWIDEEFLEDFIGDLRGYTYDRFKELLEVGYKVKELIQYIHDLRYYQNVDDSVNYVIRALKDYAFEAGRLSPGFTKYPKYFLTTKSITSRNYRRFQEQIDEAEFEKILKPHWNKKFKVKGDLEWNFIYPEKSQELKHEAVKLNHCVSSYIGSVIKGKTDIMFMRTDPGKPEITIEVRDGKIVQARGRRNRGLSSPEQKVLDLYQGHLNKILQEA